MERASRDCFNNGGALAEVVSLYEGMGQESSFDHSKESSEATEPGNHRLAIEVRCLFGEPWFFGHAFYS